MDVFANIPSDTKEGRFAPLEVFVALHKDIQAVYCLDYKTNEVKSLLDLRCFSTIEFVRLCLVQQSFEQEDSGASTRISRYAAVMVEKTNA